MEQQSIFDEDIPQSYKEHRREILLEHTLVEAPLEVIREAIDGDMVRFDDGRHLLVEADSLEVMRKLPDNCVDLVITDPPYTQNTHTQAKTNRGGQRGYGVKLVKFDAFTEEMFREAFTEMGRLTRRWVIATVDYRHAFDLERDPPPGLKVLRIGVWCLSGGTWIWARTAKGDMPIMLKDLVRLDPTTVQLWNGDKWTQVTAWTPSTDTGGNLRLTLRSGEQISCTGNHIWPTARGNVIARELLVGDKILTCTLPEPDGCSTPAYLTDDVLWLAGLFMAEGSRSNSAIQLSLNADEAMWLPRIKAAVHHLGATMGHTFHGNRLNVRIWGRVAHAAIDTYIGGRDSKTWHLRNTAWMLPNQSLQKIVEGYLDGDGHYDTRNDRWQLGFTRNHGLARDIRVAAARLGATLTLRPAISTIDGHKYPTYRGEWRWNRSGHWNERDRGEIVAIQKWKSSKFWDVSVADEPHLFALASGVLTHNCKDNPMPQISGDRPGQGWESIVFMHRTDVGPTWSGGGRSSVWRTPVVRGPHPTMKPVSMVQDWVCLFSEPDNLVLDPFVGSGTTGVAAKQAGRRSVSIEKDPQWLKFARDQLAQGVFE